MYFDSGKVCILEENDFDDIIEEEKEIYIIFLMRFLIVGMF